jgi:hypothetical protein
MSISVVLPLLLFMSEMSEVANVRANVHSTQRSPQDLLGDRRYNLRENFKETSGALGPLGRARSPALRHLVAAVKRPPRKERQIHCQEASLLVG